MLAFLARDLYMIALPLFAAPPAAPMPAMIFRLSGLRLLHGCVRQHGVSYKSRIDVRLFLR
jgi:hypothetical protein